MTLHTILAAVLAGLPATELQGEWQVRRILIQEPGAQACCDGLKFSADEYVWHVRGTRVETRCWEIGVTKKLVILPNPIPGQRQATEIQFTEYEGVGRAAFYVVYTGSYTLKEGKAELILRRSAPIPGLVNTNGTKYLTIVLERPKPRELRKTFGFGHSE